MAFFKVKRLRRARQPTSENESDGKPVSHTEERRRINSMIILNKIDNDSYENAEEDEDDDYISNEVQRRFQELRRNSFMSLIPEETGNEDEEDAEEEEEAHQVNFTEKQEIDVPNYQLFWCDFDTFYRSYCQRMLVFDKMNVQLLRDADSYVTRTMSPRSTHKKLSLPFRCLYLKKIDQPRDETEQLQQLEISPLQDLETAYVAQICLSWEALHCQYTLLKQKVSAQPESRTHYNHSAQEFQHFQVLLQRFIEDEPYQEGFRPEQFARARILLPKLLHVPSVQGSDTIGTEEAGLAVLGSDLIRLMESSILTYRSFIKMDKKKSNGIHNLFGGRKQVLAAINKKKKKLKELANRKRGSKHKTWPSSDRKVDVLLAIIEVKLVARVMGMIKLTKEQLTWCEDKMKKLRITDGKLQRESSPLLFPC